MLETWNGGLHSVFDLLSEFSENLNNTHRQNVKETFGRILCEPMS